MPIYQGLARIYDRLMEGVDYQEWANNILTLTKRYREKTESVLDLACGTGNTSIPLAKFGWRVTGIDISLPMLQQARNKASEAKEDIIFLQQDMREIELTREFDLVVCFQDGLNYLLSREELDKALRSVYDKLVPGGLFIFDLNLVEKYSKTKGEISYIETEDYSLVYQTNFLPEGQIWEINVTGFVKEDAKYIKFHEIHREKHHHLEDVKQSLQTTGFYVLDVCDSFSLDAPEEDSRRIFVVAQKVEGRE